jgi:hypothetical protein
MPSRSGALGGLRYRTSAVLPEMLQSVSRHDCEGRSSLHITATVSRLGMKSESASSGCQGAGASPRRSSFHWKPVMEPLPVSPPKRIAKLVRSGSVHASATAQGPRLASFTSIPR